MPELRVVELDFNTIKENLKNFLRGQEEFADYDFDGAGLSVLLDILAYNTHYNAVLTHLQANEMFIDTAIKRASVVSIAKSLGYTPRSTTCARAIVDLIVTPTGSETTLTLDPSVTFTASANGVTFTFNVNDTYTVNKADGVFTFTGVELLEGTRLTNTFITKLDTVNGPFIIPVDNIDLNTLYLTVADYWAAPNPVTYTRAEGIVDITGTDKVFWIEENPFGQYQILFGDNIIGKQLEVGNVVSISYLAANGTGPNGARTFSLSGAIDGETNVAITTTSQAASGATKEGIDQIRFNAPKFNATRNRAVTAQDYQSLILSRFARAKSVAVWGGEDNDPPIYGTIFITLDPNDGEVITEGDKDFISESILRSRSVLSTQFKFVDPDYLYVGFDVDLKYDPRATTLSSSDLRAAVRQQIQSYFTTNLQTLGKTFIYSQFVDAIKATIPNSNVIVGVLTKMHLQRRIDVLPETFHSQNIEFLAPVHPGTLTSNYFTTTVSDVAYDVSIQDFNDANILDYTGTGTLKLIRTQDSAIINQNVGTIDYATGKIEIKNLWVDRFFGSTSKLYLQCEPQDLGKNISPGIIRMTEVSTSAVVPLPSKNTVISLDSSEADSVSNLLPGLTIKATPFFEVV